MKLAHEWNVTPAQARSIQKRLSARVIHADEGIWPPSCVAGVDIGFERSGRVTRAAAVVLSFPGLELLESVMARCITEFPYVPGLLSFRECPAALEALHALERAPDVVVCDGQGYAHPRRMGFACHLGLRAGLRSVGVAKTRLVGTHPEPPQQRGAWVPLTDREEVIGAVVRTRVGVKPVYVSVGHRMTLTTAIELTLALTPRYRLPETTRLAHRLASG